MSNLSHEISTARLIDDFKVVVTDAEALLIATAGQGGEKLAEIRTRVQGSLREAQARLADAQAELLAKTRAAAKATDAYVHDNPWQVIGLASGLGLLVGWLMGRR
jgi:ElaB/YqjD/DUF883 family membrane-anchored ribosome-binding protein